MFIRIAHKYFKFDLIKTKGINHVLPLHDPYHHYDQVFMDMHTHMHTHTQLSFILCFLSGLMPLPFTQIRNLGGIMDFFHWLLSESY